jgi:O-antigen/teichoic acid export membrane protein
MTAAVAENSPPPVASSGTSAHGLFKKGFWALADQGLFAGSNCLVSVMLARWLSPTEYGAFATAFAAFLGLGVIHTSLLTEPMLVFAPDRYRDKHKQYFGALLHGHVLVALSASAILAVIGLILAHYQQADLSRAMYWFAVAAPFILFLWLMRRTCYGQFNPKRAAIGGMGYLLLIVAALTLVHCFGTLNIASAMIMIAVASLIAGIWLGVGYVDLRVSQPLLRDVVAEHLRYGRWATATQILGFIPGNIYYFILPKMATLEQSGALRAMSNLYMPLLQASTALCLLLLPAFVRTQGTAQGKRLHRLAILVLVGGPFIYWLVLGCFHNQVVTLVYGGKYHEYSGLLWILGIPPITSGACGVYGSLLRARQKLNAVLWGSVVAAVVAVILGITLTKQFGLAGVCWSISITYALHHITLWLFSRGLVSNRAKSNQSFALEPLTEAA